MCVCVCMCVDGCTINGVKKAKINIFFGNYFFTLKKNCLKKNSETPAQIELFFGF